jgi:hypothetical protein
MEDVVVSSHMNDYRSADPQQLCSSMVQRSPNLCLSKIPNDNRQSYSWKALRLYVSLLSSAFRYTSDTAYAVVTPCVAQQDATAWLAVIRCQCQGLRISGYHS